MNVLVALVPLVPTVADVVVDDVDDDEDDDAIFGADDIFAAATFFSFFPTRVLDVDVGVE
jgi:hypothetical protein